MKLSTVLSAFLFVTTSLAVPATAEAGDGDKVLKMVDSKAQVFEDASYDATMKIKKGDQVVKTLMFEMTMKGLDLQLINFTSPGDVAGMKVLMTDPASIWTYQPEFKKVRKIAAHMQKQGFLGSHFRAEDMTLAHFADRFDASIIGQEGKQTTLELTPKAGVEATFAKLQLVIDAGVGGVTIIRYLDSAGTVEREQRREDWKKIAGKPFPMRIVMEDKKAGESTVIELSNIKVNQGVSDELFSRRTLLRG